MPEGLADEGRIDGGDPAITKRPKPQFVTIGEGKRARPLCSTGRYHPGLAADYLLTNHARWVPVGELSRVFYGANTMTGKDKVRRRMSETFNYLLAWKKSVLLYEFDGLRINAVKVYDPVSEADRQAAASRVERMAHRCQWTQSQYELVERVMRAEEAAHH